MEELLQESLLSCKLCLTPKCAFARLFHFSIVPPSLSCLLIVHKGIILHIFPLKITLAVSQIPGWEVWIPGGQRHAYQARYSLSVYLAVTDCWGCPCPFSPSSVITEPLIFNWALGCRSNALYVLTFLPARRNEPCKFWPTEQEWK